MTQETDYTYKTAAPAQPFTPMIIALWVLVALVFMLNFQVMQLTGDMKEMQARSSQSSLTPTGPLPDGGSGGDYTAELSNIASKLDRMVMATESLQNNVAGIKSDTSAMHSGGSSAPPIPGQ